VFLAELGRVGEARIELEKALALARTEPERRLMERRLGACAPGYADIGS
jgi:predicted RNA polymerase sigma factor